MAIERTSMPEDNPEELSKSQSGEPSEKEKLELFLKTYRPGERPLADTTYRPPFKKNKEIPGKGSTNLGPQPLG